MIRGVTLLVAVILSVAAAGQADLVLTLEGDVEGTHDPSVIRQGSTYYVFATGLDHPGHLPIRCSNDLTHWKFCGHVFDEIPGWATQEIPGVKALWAPDISFEDGEYRLYYAVSTFGKRDSAIGLATNKTLDALSPDYKWSDRGMVLRSHSDQDDWNAIDPNLVKDASGGEWLDFGSFWGGIKMRRIDPKTGKVLPADSELYDLAARPHDAGKPDAIEAPFIIRHGELYYLFVSFDFCCRGAKSTYNVVVGRSPNITGPYVDASGKPMLEGGGTRITNGTEHWQGPGHEAVLQDEKRDYLFFHAYNATTGKPSLQISTLAWKNGWPKAGALP